MLGAESKGYSNHLVPSTSKAPSLEPMEDGGRAVVASEPLWTIRVTALTKPWL
jgi:hypothetical protein